MLNYGISSWIRSTGGSCASCRPTGGCPTPTSRQRSGLTTSPCLERVRRLERGGVIKGYTAVIEPRAVGTGLLVFVELSLTYTSPEIFADFKRAIARLPEILECHLVSGDFDYLIKARIPDMNAYRTLLGELLRHLPGVHDIGYMQPSIYHRGLMVGETPNIERPASKARCSPTTMPSRAAPPGAMPSSPACTRCAPA